jgi:hypothetical protein
MPLSGFRIAIKDLFDLKGVHTGRGNRAYRACYPESGHTSEFTKRAIEAGAVIVGKTKTAELGGSQEVVADWTDYSYAFNPRADEYIVACGSSTGSTSALASYSWLDVGGVTAPRYATTNRRQVVEVSGAQLSRRAYTAFAPHMMARESRELRCRVHRLLKGCVHRIGYLYDHLGYSRMRVFLARSLKTMLQFSEHWFGGSPSTAEVGY